MTRVAINGFGRIGRCFLRMALGDNDIEIVAVNDLGAQENLAYLLQYDSVYGVLPHKVTATQGALMIGEKKIPFLQQKDPASLPWKDLTIDVVVEASGVFREFAQARAHLTAGAQRVVISAPAKDEMQNAATVLMGINEEKCKECTITSNASCTTNATSPVIAILDEALGIEKAILNTTHAYTSSQSVVDTLVKGNDMRRGRAAAHNIVPSSTGAAIAVTKAYPTLAGHFDGIALRVPVIAGSLVDITCVVKQETTVEAVNVLLKTTAEQSRWQGIFTTTSDPIVSSDVIGNPHASIVDLALTRVVDGTLVKVLAWYDNEWGYTHTLLEHVKAVGRAMEGKDPRRWIH